MKEERLSKDLEGELLALLVLAEQATDATASISNLDGFSNPRNNSQSKLLATVSKLAINAAAVPLLIIAIVLYIALWPFVFLIANAIRFGKARIGKALFRVEWFIFPIGAFGGVATLGELKIVIYPNDHPPPHFHVITDLYNAKFDIDKCELIGRCEIPGKHIRAIKTWHAEKVPLLQEKWLATRPGNIKPLGGIA